MPIHGCSGTLPDRLTNDAPTGLHRNASTLPARVGAGRPRRASDARPPGLSTTGNSGLSYTIRYFLASKDKRATMQIERAEARLTASMHRFIDQWKRREVDELPPHRGARLLGEACVAALPQGQEIAQSAVMAILRRCLAAVKQPEELSQLYNDLVAPQAVTRALAERQSARLRGVATHMLDALEQALAETLAERIGTPLLGRLLIINEHSSEAASKVRETLEQLHGIGLWLSSASRSPAQILAHTLDILTNDELGQLAAQAWPDLSVRDEHYGAEARQMNAALAFLQACEGDALNTWRAAMLLQLDARKRMVAVRTAIMVGRVADPGRLGEAMRVVYGQLDNAAIVLTGKLHNASLLRASVRTDVLMQVLRLLPEGWRGQGLRALRARELSSIKSSLAESAGLTAMDTATETSVTALIDSVQEDMLASDRRSVETALASLHEAIAMRDRTVAVSRLGALVDALRELRATLDAFNIDMPAALEDSLRQLLDRMRALLPGGLDDAESSNALRALSDAELGGLRQAASTLSPYGTLLDKDALKSAIALRSKLPARAEQAMDALLAALAHGEASLVDVHARLRDVADVLVRLNERRVTMGAETSADANDALVADVVERAKARWSRPPRSSRSSPLPSAPTASRGSDHAAGVAERRSMERLGITGDTLSQPLYALADWISRQPRDETLRLDRCAARLTIASRLEQTLRDTDGRQGEADTAPGSMDGNALRAVLAGEYGVEWDAGNILARPCISRAVHAAVEARLKSATDDHAADDAEEGDWAHLPHGERQARSIRLYAVDGESAWFLVDERFEQDMLGGPGMALAVEGVSARGVTVYSPGFAAHLSKDARFAAVGAAMHALRELAGGAMPAILQCLHRGIPKACTAALAALPERLLLHLPDGSSVGFPTVLPAATEFRVRREADGEYSVDVFLTWTGTASLPRLEAFTLDASRSFIKVAFVLAADARGRMYGLRETVELRYRLERSVARVTRDSVQ